MKKKGNRSSFGCSQTACTQSNRRKKWECHAGYARVSTTEQNLALQRDALKHADCGKIIEDTASSGKVQRDGLGRVRKRLRKGDVLVVWRLDRLGRSLRHLIELMTELEGQGIGFQSITEAIDTTSPGGMPVFDVTDRTPSARRS